MHAGTPPPLPPLAPPLHPEHPTDMHSVETMAMSVCGGTGFAVVFVRSDPLPCVGVRARILQAAHARSLC